MFRALRGHAPGIGLVLLIALTARLTWVAYIHPDPNDGRFDDTVWYRGAAHYVAHGEGYLNPFSGTPTAAWPPGYPAFLAAVFKLVGEGVMQTIAANIVVSLLTIVVVYAVGLVMFSERTALIGAGALAVWPGQIYFTSLTLSEPLFTLLFTIAVLLMLRVAIDDRRRALLLLAFGAVVALATLVRGQALVLLPCAWVVWAMASPPSAAKGGDLPASRGAGSLRRSFAWAALAIVAACVVIAPWTLRNWSMLESPVVISTNTGPNFWIGHHDGATGRMSTNGELPPLEERGDRSFGEWEAANDRLALRKGLEYALTHPLDEVRLTGAKIRALYEADSVALDWNSAYERGTLYGDFENALRAGANGFWFAMIALSGVGLVTIARGEAPDAPSEFARLRFALPALVLTWTAAHIVFFGDPRFHYPIVFVFALTGAHGVVAIVDGARHRVSGMQRRYAQA